MMSYPPTSIIRHQRENLKKCSLSGLEGKEDFRFYLYPDCALDKKILPDLSNSVMLDLGGEPLSREDSQYGLILIDATWRLAEKMVKQLTALHDLPKRSIPSGFQTAYPRRQLDCSDPSSGLASIEALFIAYTILGRATDHLLDHYYWKEAFLMKNKERMLDINKIM